jgi:hypothetical protein
MLVTASALAAGPAVSTAQAGASAAPQTPATSPGVLPPGSVAFGRTYAQWSAAWWQWELQQTNSPDSPAVNPDPGTPTDPAAFNCALGQSGKVWFLGGIGIFENFSEAWRTCSVPAGTALFFPLTNAWTDNLSCPGTPQGTLTGSELAEVVSQLMDGIVPGSMAATIDGRSVAGLHDSTTPYRAAVGGFSYTLPDNAALSLACPGDPFPAGTIPPLPPGAYADGVYLLLAPLSVGVHHLAFSSAVATGNGTFSQDIHYTITVTAPGH